MQNELMKNLPPNAWRKCLDETDWNFGLIEAKESNELPRCLEWELCRERAQAETGGTLPKSPLTDEPTKHEIWLGRFWRDKVRQLPDWWENGQKELICQLSQIPSTWIPHPDFPQLSYFKHREKEKWNRIQEDKPMDWLSVDMSWITAFKYKADEIHEAATTCPSPTVWAWKYTEIVPMTITWDCPDEEIQKAFSQWLKERRPDSIPEPPPLPTNKGGRGASLPQAKAKLKALAAWRLLQHYDGKWVRAHAHPGASYFLSVAGKLESQFSRKDAWDKAGDTVLKAMKRLVFTHFR